MPYPVEQNDKFAAYAHPGRLVSTEWLATVIEEGALKSGQLVVLESDEDVLLYETGHIPGAVKIDWHTELNDELTRDFVDAKAFAAMASAKGISRDSTVVIYGDKSNWWARQVDCRRPGANHRNNRSRSRRLPGGGTQ